jgi:hypothetical protein
VVSARRITDAARWMRSKACISDSGSPPYR